MMKGLAGLADRRARQVSSFATTVFVVAGALGALAAVVGPSLGPAWLAREAG